MVLNDFEQFIVDVEYVLGGIDGDLIEREGKFQKDKTCLELSSYYRDNTFLRCASRWLKIKSDFFRLEIKSYEAIKDLILIQGNTKVIPYIKLKLSGLVEQLKEVEKMYLKDITYMPKNSWFFDLYSIVNHYNESFLSLLDLIGYKVDVEDASDNDIVYPEHIFTKEGYRVFSYMKEKMFPDSSKRGYKKDVLYCYHKLKENKKILVKIMEFINWYFEEFQIDLGESETLSQTKTKNDTRESSYSLFLEQYKQRFRNEL